mgnify:CR=1 FL=1
MNNMDFGLRQEVQQKLVITPQLRQAIAILQLSSLELNAVVEKELLENPVLEIAETENKRDEPEEQEETIQAKPDSAERYVDWAEYFDAPFDNQYVPVEKGERSTFEAVVSDSVLLKDHLEFQLHLAIMDQRLLNIGQYLIGCIDDNGYLEISVEEASRELGEPVDILENVLAVIQTFDPAGVGARSLSECLAIQADQKGISDGVVLTIIRHHLDDIAAGRQKQIAEKLKCTPHAVQEAIDIIRTFDPKPGQAFGGGQSLYIIPDVTVQRVNGEYVILINENDTPRLTINPYYRHVIREADQIARKYVEGRIQAAVWFIKSIEQRRRTLYKLIETLIELQRDFFDHGSKHLQPLTMKKVADHAGVHESTVSRAIANKYAATPHGLFSLRAFFSTSVQDSSGLDVAVSRIKGEIREMIGKEDPFCPYSDQVLTEMFAAKGIKVSRRTVAKYREEMGIPSSAKRKRY